MARATRCTIVGYLRTSTADQLVGIDAQQTTNPQLRSLGRRGRPPLPPAFADRRAGDAAAAPADHERRRLLVEEARQVRLAVAAGGDGPELTRHRFAPLAARASAGGGHRPGPGRSVPHS